MSTIDKQSRIPLYCQLMDLLVDEIKNNLNENDKLMPERDICEKFDVSRSTVRQALQEMEKEGYIYKLHGKGTFVSTKRINQELVKFYSFTEEMKKNGKNPMSRVLDFEIIACNEKICSKMNLATGNMVYKFTRLRLADDIAMMIETTYVPYEIFPGIVRSDLDKEAMYDIFAKRFDAKITRAEEYFEPIMPNEHEAKHLNISRKLPGLKIERYTYEGHRVIEYTVSIARGDKFKYHVTLAN